MDQPKLPYDAPESNIFALTPEQCILDISNTRSMDHITGESGTAGDHEDFYGSSYNF